MSFVTFQRLGTYGRMSNMMFQLAATIGYARKHGFVSTFPRWAYQDHFAIGRSGMFANVLPQVKYRYEEPCYGYREIPKFSGNTNLHGYFQSYKYFEHCKYEIRNYFTPIKEMHKKQNVCSIHVRRTDYLKFKDCHTNLGMDYYQKAIELCPADKYIVFSDDVGWCKENFKGDKVIISEGAPDYEDFRMQVECSSHIIANSSFSWWAAWVADDSKVIAPRQWFGPTLTPTHPITDLIPEHWTLI